MRKKDGFTLIEMMIVVAILAIIATIAIPNLLRSRVQANESAAIQGLRTVMSAQAAFHASNAGFATNFDELTAAVPAYLADQWDPANGGYLYVLGGDRNNFTLNANAKQYGVTGNHGYYTDASGVIRYAVMSDADSSGTPIG